MHQRHWGTDEDSTLRDMIAAAVLFRFLGFLTDAACHVQFGK